MEEIMQENPTPALSQHCPCGTRNLDALDLVLEKYRDTPGNLIMILQDAQDLFGYLPRTVIRRISKATGHTEAKIFGVVTFYAQFRLEPIGKYLILLCQGTACHVSGSREIEEAISGELGIRDKESTPDQLFTLNNVACLGCCSLAPVMMIRTSDSEETYGNLTTEKVIGILDDLRRKEGLI